MLIPDFFSVLFVLRIFASLSNLNDLSSSELSCDFCSKSFFNVSMLNVISGFVFNILQI